MLAKNTPPWLQKAIGISMFIAFAIVGIKLAWAALWV